MQNRDLRTRAHRHMGKVECNVAASDEDQPFWQIFEVEKFVAPRQVLLTRNLSFAGQAPVAMSTCLLSSVSPLTWTEVAPAKCARP